MCWEPWLSCSDCCFSMFCCVAVLITMLSFGSWCSFWFTELSSYFHFLKESIFGAGSCSGNTTQPPTHCLLPRFKHSQTIAITFSTLYTFEKTVTSLPSHHCLHDIHTVLQTWKTMVQPKIGRSMILYFSSCCDLSCTAISTFYINICSFLLKHTAATHCLQKNKKQRMPGSKGVHRGKGNVDKGGVWDIGYGFSSFWWHEQNHFIIGWEGKVIQIATGQKLDHLPMWMQSLSQYSLTRPRTCRRSKLFLCKHVS